MYFNAHILHFFAIIYAFHRILIIFTQIIKHYFDEPKVLYTNCR
jgi:hypothetical protein